MASVRLTDSLRADIKHRLLDKGGYVKVIEQKEQAYKQACKVFYETVFADYLSAFAFIPQRFFRYSATLTVVHDGANENIAAECRQYRNGVPIYIPDGMPSMLYDITLDELGIKPDDEVWLNLLKVRQAWSDAILKRNEASDKVMQVLNSVNTTHQLLKLWADVEPILNELMPKATVAHPVGIPIADLNTMFGLNKEQYNGS